MSVLAAVLLGVAGIELAALIVLAVLLVRSRRTIGQLESAAQLRETAAPHARPGRAGGRGDRGAGA